MAVSGIDLQLQMTYVDLGRFALSQHRRTLVVVAKQYTGESLPSLVFAG
jgi:hypothetical protein